MGYDNTNRGALFHNERKTKENQPDFTGKIDVNGKEYYISGWAKTSGAGKDFISLSVSEPQGGGGGRKGDAGSWLGGGRGTAANTPTKNSDQGGSDAWNEQRQRAETGARSGISSPDLDDDIPF